MRNILEYLEKSATNYPDKNVLADENAVCSYNELKENCQRIGSALADKITPCTPVAVLMDKGINAIFAFLGTVYAGAYYVLINPDLPLLRQSQIQSVLNAKCVITDAANKELALKLFSKEAVILIEDLKKSEIDRLKIYSIRGCMIDTDPLYANFTSGSTGVPKGVVVSHRSVIDFIDEFTELFDIKDDDIIGNQAPFDFDVSVKDIYSTIKTGCTMFIIPKRLFSHPKDLIDTICIQKITTLIWAVSALCLISTFHGLDYRVPETVQKVIFSGEVMPLKHLKIWLEHLPNAMFVNVYGPTEITCNCTYYIIDKKSSYEHGIPIGKAFPNEQVFLLNSDNCEVKLCNEIGEICVRGTTLSMGYYRNSEQTARAFVQNPLNNNYIDIIYRTGDLGRYDENGNLYFCGRKDFQIKYMGHRVELEEIETAVSKIDGIERCCCVFDEEKQKLYGFYIGNVDKKELHCKLREILPNFMIPGSLHCVSYFPLTKNGKVDRTSLLKDGTQK